jgi:hypothetical protein
MVTAVFKLNQCMMRTILQKNNQTLGKTSGKRRVWRCWSMRQVKFQQGKRGYNR